MKPASVLLRLWPFWLHIGFSLEGWHFQRTVGTVLAPVIYIGTEAKGPKNSALVIVLFFFAITIAWRP